MKFQFNCSTGNTCPKEAVVSGLIVCFWGEASAIASFMSLVQTTVAAL